MPGVKSFEITKYADKAVKREQDLVAEEEPLEIRLQYGAEKDRKETAISVTMRTPGNDLELALGFLHGENIIASYQDVLSVRHCEQAEPFGNTVKVSLRPGTVFDLEKLNRHFYTTSSCGLCGKASIEALENSACGFQTVQEGFVEADTLLNAADQLWEGQSKFRFTGGVHAAAFFNRKGKPVLLREDVGRHNALDKCVGASLCLEGFEPSGHFVFLSGRISFELVQKAAVRGLPLIAAVGAPSSLAVESARSFGITLAGFVRGNRLNVYSFPERIKF